MTPSKSQEENNVCECGHNEERHFWVAHSNKKGRSQVCSSRDDIADCPCKGFKPQKSPSKNHKPEESKYIMDLPEASGSPSGENHSPMKPEEVETSNKQNLGRTVSNVPSSSVDTLNQAIIEIINEIKKLREDRRKELTKGFPNINKETIEKYLDEERHDFEFIWGNPRTDILEAKLEGFRLGEKALTLQKQKFLEMFKFELENNVVSIDTLNKIRRLLKEDEK